MMVLTGTLIKSFSRRRPTSKLSYMITTAIDPCLGTRKHGGLRRRPNKAKQLREQIRNTESKEHRGPPPLSGVAKRCPYTSTDRLLSYAQMDLQLADLNVALKSSLEKLHKDDKERLDLEIKLIRNGQLSNREIVLNISAAADKIKSSSDRNLVKAWLGWYKCESVKAFENRFEEVFPKLTTYTQQLLMNAMEVPLDDFNSKEDRIIEACIDALSSEQREHYYQRKQDLLLRLHYGDVLSTKSIGRSMLPTIWESSKIALIPLHPTIDSNALEELQVGNVVAFIVFFKNGNAKILGKRVTGLPGDHVQNIQGQTVRVPKDCFWAVGDNQAESYDSRHFGAVPQQNLKAIFRFAFTFFPPRFRLL